MAYSEYQADRVRKRFSGIHYFDKEFSSL